MPITDYFEHRFLLKCTKTATETYICASTNASVSHAEMITVVPSSSVHALS